MTRRWWDAAFADDFVAKGMALAAAEDYEKAAKTFRAAEHPEKFHQLARLELARGRRKEAVAAVEEALRKEPRHWPALALRGQLALATGDFAAAVSAWEKALALIPHLSFPDLEGARTKL